MISLIALATIGTVRADDLFVNHIDSETSINWYSDSLPADWKISLQKSYSGVESAYLDKNGLTIINPNINGYLQAFYVTKDPAQWCWPGGDLKLNYDSKTSILEMPEVCVPNDWNEGSMYIIRSTINRTYPLSSTYNGATTDFSSYSVEQLSSINNVVLEKSSTGKIQFTQTLDLSNSPDLNSNVVIQPNMIAINSTGTPQLNRSARLTFYGLPYNTTPQIYYDGKFTTDNSSAQLCDVSLCSNISYSAGTLSFDIQHFSMYVIAEPKPVIVEETKPKKILTKAEQKQLTTLNNQINSYNKTITSYQTQIINQQKAINNNVVAINNTQARIEQLQKQIMALQGNIETYKSKALTCNNNIIAYQSQISSYIQKTQEAQSAITKLIG